MFHIKTILVLCTLIIWISSTASAIEEHFGIHINQGSFQIHPANSSDSDEIKAYIDAFPDAPQSGVGYGGFLDFDLNLSGFESIGIGVTRHTGKVTINKSADPENTPDDSSDDIVIKQARRDGISTVLFLKTITVATIGIGWEDGAIRFDVETANKQNSTRNFPFSYSYIHASLSSVNFTGGDGPYIAFVTHIVTSLLGTERGSFSGTTYSLALGWVF